MKKLTLLAVSGALAVSGLSQDSVQLKSLTRAEKAQINKEVNSALQQWEKAFNAKDPIALANLYDLNTDVIYDDDVHHRSRQSMLKRFQERFRKEPNLRQKITEVQRTISSAHVVIETGVWENTGASDLSRPPRGRYSCTWMKKGQEWLIVHDRAWAMAKENDRSELRTRDQLSKQVHEFFEAFARNDVKFLKEFFAEDVKVIINGTTVAISRKDYLVRVNHLVNTLFKDIRFEKVHVHTNYFSPNSLAFDGKTFGDLRPSTIWTNAWADFSRIGRSTMREQVNGVHLDFRWENGKVVEMLVYGEATFTKEEEAAFQASLGPHATVADSEHYKVEFENEYVKVIRVKYGPKEKSPIHSHGKLVGVHLTDAKAKFTPKGGEAEIRDIKSGSIGGGPAVDHTVENLTDKNWETILVEFKKKYPHSVSKLKLDATIVDSNHYKVEIENDWVRVIRAKYGPNDESVMHEHNPGVVVFLSNTKHQLINEDGSKINSDFKAGHVIWADAVTHKGINLENEPLELVFFELK